MVRVQVLWLHGEVDMVLPDADLPQNALEPTDGSSATTLVGLLVWWGKVARKTSARQEASQSDLL